MLLYWGTERITWKTHSHFLHRVNYNYIKSISKRILAKSIKQIHRVLLLFFRIFECFLFDKKRKILILNQFWWDSNTSDAYIMKEFGFFHFFLSHVQGMRVDNVEM